MSMISSLIDELNKSEDEWNESNMFELARMCRNAAYTILELKNDADLLRAMWSQERTEKRCYMADNAKLRELVRQMYPKAKAFLQMGVRLGCNDTLSYDWYLQLRELGVEVDA